MSMQRGRNKQKPLKAKIYLTLNFMFRGEKGEDKPKKAKLWTIVTKHKIH